MLDQPLATQVAVEGAQARGLALQRRRGHGRALSRTAGQLGQERREIAVASLGRAQIAAPQELAELQQVRAVGLERVARQAALQLQVGEEVRAAGAPMPSLAAD